MSLPKDLEMLLPNELEFPHRRVVGISLIAVSILITIYLAVV